MTVEDKWHLGSNTKAMTAALFGRLVDQGRARWGARVVDLLQSRHKCAGVGGRNDVKLSSPILPVCWIKPPWGRPG